MTARNDHYVVAHVSNLWGRTEDLSTRSDFPILLSMWPSHSNFGGDYTRYGHLSTGYIWRRCWLDRIWSASRICWAGQFMRSLPTYELCLPLAIQWSTLKLTKNLRISSSRALYIESKWNKVGTHVILPRNRNLILHATCYFRKHVADIAWQLVNSEMNLLPVCWQMKSVEFKDIRVQIIAGAVRGLSREATFYQSRRAAHCGYDWKNAENNCLSSSYS